MNKLSLVWHYHILITQRERERERERGLIWNLCFTCSAYSWINFYTWITHYMIKSMSCCRNKNDALGGNSSLHTNLPLIQLQQRQAFSRSWTSCYLITWQEIHTSETFLLILLSPTVSINCSTFMQTRSSLSSSQKPLDSSPHPHLWKSI
jgi:hypothetical protein